MPKIVKTTGFSRFFDDFQSCSRFKLAWKNHQLFIRFSLQKSPKIDRKTVKFRAGQAFGSTTLQKADPEKPRVPRKRFRTVPGGSGKLPRGSGKSSRAGPEPPGSGPEPLPGRPGTIPDPPKMVPGQPEPSPGRSEGLPGASGGASKPAGDPIWGGLKPQFGPARSVFSMDVRLNCYRCG